ncbi:thiamine phosphate synthase [Fulvivirga sp. RKSG066]|uniref:thiamine phosphate synthase n=1 Tax=Fulvivirga aurantia TaxID=2529383 RepID=UPI0012BC976E|nr:thiamine phosphate synthase [Fulvivirga aurantia]MTI22062.1 thiamine phosphate synthase [Fulvivirga aurantia]
MKLIVISSDNNMTQEGEYINAMFAEGMEYFHLRKPYASESELRQFLMGIDHSYMERVVTHSHYQLVDEFGLRGIHINSWNHETLPKKVNHCSVSSHGISELKKKSKFDYAFLSPIFDSISKENHKAAFCLKHLKDVLTEIEVNVIALGGVDASKIDTCEETGFNGVAVCGSIWQSENPVETFKIIKEKC